MPSLSALVIRAAAGLLTAAGLVPGIGAAQNVAPDRAASLERLVRQDCGSCHGMTLKGGLGPDLRAETLAGTPPEALVAIILDGVPGAAMPPWRPLMSEDDAAWIAQYLLKGEQP